MAVENVQINGNIGLWEIQIYNEPTYVYEASKSKNVKGYCWRYHRMFLHENILVCVGM